MGTNFSLYRELSLDTLVCVVQSQKHITREKCPSEENNNEQCSLNTLNKTNLALSNGINEIGRLSWNGIIFLCLPFNLAN